MNASSEVATMENMEGSVTSKTDHKFRR